jgi:hypothetical protein
VIDLLARAERLPELLAADTHLQRRGRFTNVPFLLGFGDTDYHADIRNGTFSAFVRGPQMMRSWRFALRGDAEAWAQFWQPVPPPDFHDIFALTKFGRFRLEGDLQPFLCNLLFFKDLLALPRKAGGQA